MRCSSSFTFHTHTERVASASSHRSNYVSTTRKHFVVPSQSQSLYICPFTLAQFSFYFTCFSPFFLCFSSLFRFLRMLLACVSNFYIFRFLFMSLFRFVCVSIAISIFLLSIFNFDCTFFDSSAK